MKSSPNPDSGYCYPAEIISYAVWLYHRFTLSFREIEEILAERGIVVSYETIRQWCLKFGPIYAAELRRRRPRPGERWHLDEMWVVINSEVYWLWRAVDEHNQTLDILIQKRHNKGAAKRFFKKLLKGLRYLPQRIVTDKLKSYGVAHREIMPSVEHSQHKALNMQAEVSHQPTRQQERQMRGFKSAAQAQRFLSVHARVNNFFRPRRHRLKAAEYRLVRDEAFQIWQQVTCAHVVS